MTVNRRKFLGSLAAASAVGLLAPRVSRAAESSIEILINEPIGKIHPDIYSHFIEQLGGVIYDGKIGRASCREREARMRCAVYRLKQKHKTRPRYDRCK